MSKQQKVGSLHEPPRSSKGKLKKEAEGADASPKIRFSKKTAYDVILASFKDEFDKKWNLNERSPMTGLSGYTELEIIGKGAFGKVILVSQEDTDNVYACKVMEKDHIVKKKQVQHVLNEKKVLSCVDFPNLIKLIFSSKDHDRLYVGLPFLIGGELFSYHRVMRKFGENEARFYAAQVFLGLEYLHHCHVLYRDLKPENICFERNGYVTITDFGFAKKVSNRTLTLCGTPEYLCPEMIQAQPYSTSADWWSFGILIFEFCAGFSPFSEYNREVLVMYERILAGEYQMPSFFSPALKHLIKNLLTVDFTKRYGCLHNGDKDIKQHEWFKDMDWYAVLNQTMKPPYTPAVSGARDTSHYEKFARLKPQTISNFNRHEEIFEEF